MRDPKRIPKILNEIKNIWEKHPDLRLGQLIINSSRKAFLFYLEDDDLLKNLKELEKNLDNSDKK